MCIRDRPNAAHKKLAEWEAEGRLKAVITQNIDGLHQAAGSRNVLELHGSVHRNHCQRCGKFYGLEHILRTCLLYTSQLLVRVGLIGLCRTETGEKGALHRRGGGDELGRR